MRLRRQVTYPYILAKTRLQAKFTVDIIDPAAAPGSVVRTKEKYTGAVDVLRQVYAEKGLGGWYQVRYDPRRCSCCADIVSQGMQAQITKAVFSQALLFGIKDALEVYVLMSLLAYGKFRGSDIGIKSA